MIMNTFNNINFFFGKTLRVISVKTLKVPKEPVTNFDKS